MLKPTTLNPCRFEADVIYGRSIFRVYESFHTSSESGTNEYGCYSSLEKAKARLETIWMKKGYPDPKPEHKKDSGWFAYHGWDDCSIDIAKITIDEDTDNECIGYT